MSTEYSIKTRNVVAQLSEKEVSFELIEGLLKYIKDLTIPGAVLIFLPGWNLIFALMKHLQNNPIFGKNWTYYLNKIDFWNLNIIITFSLGNNAYCIIPLHSQLPREDQRRVFDPVPPGITKVCPTSINILLFS